MSVKTSYPHNKSISKEFENKSSNISIDLKEEDILKEEELDTKDKELFNEVLNTTSQSEVEKETPLFNEINTLKSFMDNDNPLFKNIQFLPVIPNQTRNNDKSKYCYPEQYQNKIFRNKTNFILFNESSYTEVPISTVFLINQLINSSTSIQQSDPQIMTEITDNISNCLNKYEEVINNQKLISDQIEAMLNVISPISETVETHSTKFDNLEDTLKATDLTQVKELKSEISQVIETYKTSNSEIEQIFTKLINEIDILKQKITELENKKQTLETSDSIDLNEFATNSMFALFKENIEKQISKLASNLNQNSNSIETENKLTIEELTNLKKAGYSPEEICRLKNLYLI